MQVTLLGSGTSHGVPMIGCRCEVCTSDNPKNKRTRSSILVANRESCFLIDTATDFRLQAIREGIERVDAVFYTHTHADHLHGIDDLRELTRRRPVALYASPANLAEIENRFPYLFQRSPYPDAKPRITPLPLRDSPVRIGRMEVLPIPVLHGSLPIHGFRVGDFAYLTDCSSIPTASYGLLAGVRILVIDALRYEPHPTHFTVSEAIAAGRRIGAQEIYLTHICHELDHARLERELPEGVYPSYDGLRIPIGG